MKIIYDYQTFNLQRYGGVSRYIYEIASRLSIMEDIDVSILAFSHINKYLKNAIPGLVIGLERPIIPKTGRVFGSFNKNLSKLWLHSQPPNILHETYYSNSKIAPNSCTTVLTVYDMIHERFNQSLAIDGARISKIKELAVKRADHIICISENTKKDLLEFIDIDQKKVSIINLGYSFIKNQYMAPSIESKPYLLYVGLREGYKNFSRLLEAYASSPNVRSDFKLVCFGTHPFSRNELNSIRELGLNDTQVIYAGSKESILPQLYSQAAAFVYPSLYEGFGIPPLEAMNFKCPVVCSNTSSIPEVVGNAGAFFDPYCIDSMISAIESVVYSTTKKEDLIEKGTQKANTFSWDKCAEKTMKLYMSLI